MDVKVDFFFNFEWIFWWDYPTVLSFCKDDCSMHQKHLPALSHWHGTSTVMALCGTVMLSPQLASLTLTIRCYNLTLLPLILLTIFSFVFLKTLLPVLKSNESIVRTAHLYHSLEYWDLEKLFPFPNSLPFSLVKASNQTQLFKKKYCKVGCKVLNVLDMNSVFRS